MKALITHCLTGLAIVLLTSTGASALAPTGPYTDTLSTGTNVYNNNPATMSASYGSSGMTLTLTGAGTEWYWSDGGGAGYNANSLAFSLDPTANQNILTIDVTSISLPSGGVLKAGAYFFNSANSGLGNALGSAQGGLSITAPGIYTLNMTTLATANSYTTATSWKGDFYLTGSSPNTVTVSELAAGAAPEPRAYVLMGLGLAALVTISKFRRGSAQD